MDSRERIDGAVRPRLAPHVRMVYNTARQTYVLLSPETVWLINDTGAAIVELCDDRRTIDEIQDELRRQYDGVGDDDVMRFVSDLVGKRGMEVHHG